MSGPGGGVLSFPLSPNELREEASCSILVVRVLAKDGISWPLRFGQRSAVCCWRFAVMELSRRQPVAASNPPWSAGNPH